MTEAVAKAGGNAAFPGQVWRSWCSLVAWLPGWMFAPTPENPPSHPLPGAPEAEVEEYEKLAAQRKSFHDETSRAIRRVFYMLIGTCLFCIITLSHAPDIQVLVPAASVKLPVLNYEIGFQAFLIVGPTVLIALTVYLHIFLGQHRLIGLEPDSRLPMLPNFSGWTPRIVVSAVYYGLVPLVLSVFAWKAWPRPYGPLLGVVVVGVTGWLLFLQARRISKKRRAIGLLLLIVTFLIYGALFAYFLVTREPNLIAAQLSKQDLAGNNFSNALLTDADLSDANLKKTDFSRAKLIRANLTGARLEDADLSASDLREAKLTQALLPEANLTGAVLSQADLSGAQLIDTKLAGANLYTARMAASNLVRADLTNADLYRNDLSGALLVEATLVGAKLAESDLTGSNLVRAKLSRANLVRANFTKANLMDADLTSVDLSGADLSEAELSQPIAAAQNQLNQACGNYETRLPKGLKIKSCSE